MRITQEQFNAIVYYVLSAYTYMEIPTDNTSSYYMYMMAVERLTAIRSGGGILLVAFQQDVDLAADILLLKRINCHDPKVSRLERAFNLLYDLLRPVNDTPERFQQDIIHSLNTHFATAFQYTQTECPSFWMHCVDVHAKGLVLAIILLAVGMSMVVLLSPYVAYIGGMMLGVGLGLLVNKLATICSEYSTLPKDILFTPPGIPVAVPIEDEEDNRFCCIAMR